jgi:hypothetical protein
MKDSSTGSVGNGSRSRLSEQEQSSHPLDLPIQCQQGVTWLVARRIRKAVG